LKRRRRFRHLNKISAVAQTDAPKSATFSTESALTGLLHRSMDGGSNRPPNVRNRNERQSGSLCDGGRRTAQPDHRHRMLIGDAFVAAEQLLPTAIA